MLDVCRTVIDRQAIVRRKPIDVLDGVVGALLDEEFAQFPGRVESHGEVQRCVAVRVLMVDRSAAVYEQLCHAPICVLASDEQQGVALLVLGVDVKVRVERFLESLEAVVTALAEDHLGIRRTAWCRTTCTLRDKGNKGWNIAVVQ